MPAWWVSHVERDWARQDFRDFVTALGRTRTVVRYDRLGTGLSDRDLPAGGPTLETEVRALEAVIAELELDRVELFGMSSGGCVAVALAASRPDVVRRLVLYGAYAEGPRVAPPVVQESLLSLIRAHWGMGSRALADVFVPHGTAAQRQAFQEFQRSAASAEHAAALLELVYRLDVAAHAERVAAPTLVLHRREDPAVPFALGRDLAARVPGARLVPLDGADHLPWLGDTPVVVEATLAFLDQDRAPPPPASEPAQPLTDREREVLRLIARGLSDRQIADTLVLSVHTVHRHVANIRAKLRQPTRSAAAAEAARAGLI